MEDHLSKDLVSCRMLQDLKAKIVQDFEANTKTHFSDNCAGVGVRFGLDIFAARIISLEMSV